MGWLKVRQLQVVEGETIIGPTCFNPIKKLLNVIKRFEIGSVFLTPAVLRRPRGESGVDRAASGVDRAAGGLDRAVNGLLNFVVKSKSWFY